MVSTRLPPRGAETPAHPGSSRRLFSRGRCRRLHGGLGIGPLQPRQRPHLALQWLAAIRGATLCLSGDHSRRQNPPTCLLCKGAKRIYPLRGITRQSHHQPDPAGACVSPKQFRGQSQARRSIRVVVCQIAVAVALPLRGIAVSWDQPVNPSTVRQLSDGVLPVALAFHSPCIIP